MSVEKHRPAVDPVRELGDDTGDAASPRGEGQHAHRRGDRPGFGCLVDGEQGGQRRRQQVVGDTCSDDRRDASFLEHLADCRRVHCGDHDRVLEQCEPLRVVDQLADPSAIDDDQGGEEVFGRSAEGVESDDGVHVTRARHRSVQKPSLEVSRHGGDITSHLPIIQSVIHGERIHTFVECLQVGSLLASSASPLTRRMS